MNQDWGHPKFITVPVSLKSRVPFWEDTETYFRRDTEDGIGMDADEWERFLIGIDEWERLTGEDDCIT